MCGGGYVHMHIDTCVCAGFIGGPPCLFHIDVSTGIPNSGPHACTASALPTELTPQPYIVPFEEHTVLIWWLQ